MLSGTVYAQTIEGARKLENWSGYAFESRKSPDVSGSQSKLRQGPLDLFIAYKCETITIQGAG